MKPGLDESRFQKVCQNGFGDGNNCFAHSMTWFRNHLYVGTTRANLVLLNYIKWNDTGLGVWPVEVPYKNHSPEFEYNQARAEIWRYDPLNESWEQVYQAPIINNLMDGHEMSREVGYRGMVVFRGLSDTRPTLYVSNYSRRGGGGPTVLRSEDGKTFIPTGKINLDVSTVRLLVPFKGRLFTAPTGKPANPNMSGVTVILESRDPATGVWESANGEGFGGGNLTVFELRGFAGYLYAGTANLEGFQIWRTRAEGKPPYEWELVIDRGAGRGKLNQIATSMMVFKNALYVGTGIQGGGFDQVNMVGPAGGEIIRINRDGSWDLIMGDIRSDGRKPLSGLPAGFGNICNGYMWRMGVHDGWLHMGTMDWSIFVRYATYDRIPEKAARMLQRIGLETVVQNQAGFEIWRTCDGENWVPVTLQGFGNPYNFGVRNIVSTPYGVFVGTANPFGPKVAVKQGDEWVYQDNPEGGLEVWQGR